MRNAFRRLVNLGAGVLFIVFAALAALLALFFPHEGWYLQTMVLLLVATIGVILFMALSGRTGFLAGWMSWAHSDPARTQEPLIGIEKWQVAFLGWWVFVFIGVLIIFPVNLAPWVVLALILGILLVIFTSEPDVITWRTVTQRALAVAVVVTAICLVMWGNFQLYQEQFGAAQDKLLDEAQSVDLSRSLVQVELDTLVNPDLLCAEIAELAEQTPPNHRGNLQKQLKQKGVWKKNLPTKQQCSGGGNFDEWKNDRLLRKRYLKKELAHGGGYFAAPTRSEFGLGVLLLLPVLFVVSPLFRARHHKAKASAAVAPGGHH